MLAAFDAFGASTAVALSRVITSFSAGKTVSPKALTDAQRERADGVLAAYDLQDAREALEEWLTDVAEDIAIGQKGGDGGSVEDAAALLEAAAEKPLDIVSLRRALGEAPVRVVEEGQEAFASLLRMGAHLIRVLQEDKAAGSVEVKPASKSVGTVRDLFYSSDMPTGLRKGFVALGRSFAAALVIARAEERGQRIAPWMALYLAETYRSGLSLVANAVESVVDGDMTDIEAARATEAARKRLLEAWWEEPVAQHCPE